MAYIDINIDVNDFLNQCSKREIEQIVLSLRKDNIIQEEIIEEKRGIWEIEFSNKLNLLKDKYFSIANEDLEVLNLIFKKYNL